MKKTFIAALFVMNSATCAVAQDPSAGPTFASNFENIKPDIAFGLQASTNSTYWGLSNTDNKPQAVFYAEANGGPFFVSVAHLSTNYLDLLPFSSETDLAVGFRPVVGKFQFNFTYWYYLVGSLGGVSQDYWDTSSSVNYDVTEKLNVGARFWYTDNYANLGFQKTLLEFTGKYKFDDKWYATGTYGTHDYEVFSPGDSNYKHWNLGVGYQISPIVRAELQYHDNDRNTQECFGGYDWCDPTVLLAVSVDTSLRSLLSGN